MLLRCRLIHITINILRNILYLVYLCSCIGLGLFMWYSCNLFFILNLIFIFINHITSLKQMHSFLYIFQNTSYYFSKITWMKKTNSSQRAHVQCQIVSQRLLIFCQFQFGIAYKSVAYKKCILCWGDIFKRSK